MKSTDHFKDTIKKHLDEYSKTYPNFLVKYQNPKKSIDDCITYILNTVKDSGASGFTDSEIYGMALHYYDEEKIDVGKEIKMNVVVNHHVELTEEEKREIKQKAIEKAINDEREKLRKKPKKKKEEQSQTSLF
jgi:hypothetical protein